MLSCNVCVCGGDDGGDIGGELGANIISLRFSLSLSLYPIMTDYVFVNDV